MLYCPRNKCKQIESRVYKKIQYIRLLYKSILITSEHKKMYIYIYFSIRFILNINTNLCIAVVKLIIGITNHFIMKYCFIVRFQGMHR